MNKAIFLDRDGTIIELGGNVAVYRPEDVKFISYSLKALKILSNFSDYKLILVTNQSGIGTKRYTENDFKETMNYMYKRFKKLNLRIEEKYYYCPHHPNERCRCRKPEPGMLEHAIKDSDIDPWQSWMIGDSNKDIDAGASVGCRTILLNTGIQGKDKLSITTPSYRVENLYKAALTILRFNYACLERIPR